MKKILLAMAIAFGLLSCNQNLDSKAENTLEKIENTLDDMKEETPKAIGGDKDENGCLTAGGYTWSQLKEDCIRIFEVGKALLPIENTESSVLATYIISEEGANQVELFTPNNNPVLLELTEENVYSNEIYSYNAAEGSLSTNGELTHKTK